MKRESLSTTETGSGMAVPHPYHYDEDKTFIVLCTLKNKILWNYSDVSVVVFIAYGKNEKHLDEINIKIAELSEDSELIEKISRSNETEIRKFL